MFLTRNYSYFEDLLSVFRFGTSRRQPQSLFFALSVDELIRS